MKQEDFYNQNLLITLNLLYDFDLLYFTIIVISNFHSKKIEKQGEKNGSLKLTVVPPGSKKFVV